MKDLLVIAISRWQQNYIKRGNSPLRQKRKEFQSYLQLSNWQLEALDNTDLMCHIIM